MFRVEGRLHANGEAGMGGIGGGGAGGGIVAHVNNIDGDGSIETIGEA